ncbi:hypothetical protein NPIL_489051 [Nephila pilipes]|uniref:Uncharacterized protein n=1 Tax=Nephila pilipes TaxID=299642 RepID=A0A8X6MSJ4_NEPPI|nr:hypothetical protein NPIL_489051 [Nephila pilipes]
MNTVKALKKGNKKNTGRYVLILGHQNALPPRGRCRVGLSLVRRPHLICIPGTGPATNVTAKSLKSRCARDPHSEPTPVVFETARSGHCDPSGENEVSKAGPIERDGALGHYATRKRESSFRNKKRKQRLLFVSLVPCNSTLALSREKKERRCCSNHLLHQFRGRARFKFLSAADRYMRNVALKTKNGMTA